MAHYCSQCGRETSGKSYSHCWDHMPLTPDTMREGMTVTFAYPDSKNGALRTRIVLVEKVAIGATTNAAYFNGPELSDGGQIKSFRFAKVIGDIRKV